MPCSMDEYNLSVIATPIACYTDAPILLYDGNDGEIISAIDKLGAENVIGIGSVAIGNVHLKSEEEIYDYISDIRDVGYLAVTNPDDALKPEVTESQEMSFERHIKTFKSPYFRKNKSCRKRRGNIQHISSWRHKQDKGFCGCAGS